MVAGWSLGVASREGCAVEAGKAPPSGSRRVREHSTGAAIENRSEDPLCRRNGRRAGAQHSERYRLVMGAVCPVVDRLARGAQGPHLFSGDQPMLLCGTGVQASVEVHDRMMPKGCDIQSGGPDSAAGLGGFLRVIVMPWCDDHTQKRSRRGDRST